MAVSDIVLSYPFLSELAWARETILKLRESKVKNLPIGLNPDTIQPDELFLEFARRDLVLEPYVAGKSIVLGTADAYTHNIATIIGYISQRRQWELAGALHRIREILVLQAQKWPVGLSWPDGQPDAVAAYFALRGLPISCFVRGRVNVGDEGAYERNIATLKSYVLKVGDEQIR